MLKSIFSICFLGVIALTGCNQSTNKSVEANNSGAKHVLILTIKKDKNIKKIYPLTDSGQLMLHLDSLPKPLFPYESEKNGKYQPEITISLSTFKNKKLFNIPLKLIPTQIGGGFLDHGEDANDEGVLPDSIRETFNLVDTITYKTEGVLVATTAKFAVVDLNGILVTLSYDVHVIDAIRTSPGDGNNHWQVGRATTVKKDLTIDILHWYSHQTDERGNRDWENEHEKWFIDSTGHIRRQLVVRKVKKNR
jgi:hypothetical protein